MTIATMPMSIERLRPSRPIKIPAGRSPTSVPNPSLARTNPTSAYETSNEAAYSGNTGTNSPRQKANKNVGM